MLGLNNRRRTRTRRRDRMAWAKPWVHRFHPGRAQTGNSAFSSRRNSSHRAQISPDSRGTLALPTWLRRRTWRTWRIIAVCTSV